MDAQVGPDEGADVTALAEEAPPTTSLVDVVGDPTKFIATLPVPPGIRVEFIEGIYRMAPPADEEHNFWAIDILVMLRTAGVAHAVAGVGYCPEPDGDGRVTAAFIPDFAVQYRRANAADLAFRKNHDGWYPSTMLHLVGEITSPGNASIDREDKYRAYARAGIPIYVLIDRRKREAIAYSEPVDRGVDSGYNVAHHVALGTKLELPDGLPTLDTAAFT
ncbi:Uma2 family endonuclease [Embleya scabrispora]|uniref:Uma2 family endonuclease n=1 Tax=Embleya scabrispora TaxID=159449 RepID=UPI00037603AA|nr:Uma2 family endonuclease [Embleya scabrispora]MYS80116.1 Uma2 family endonuclease [Streptomyces sp. SID5474]